MDLVREGDTGELDLEDPQLEEKLVNELKAQGVFDQFRKDCLSDVDTKPAYQNLRVRVDRSVSSYLSKTTWRPTLNKNQLRNQLRKYIQDMSGVEAGVDRIVDQIVNPKLNTSFMPEVENVIYKYFGTSKPEEGADDMVNGNNIDDENSHLLPNGDSNHDVGGKISTRNLSAISSDAEMLNFDNNSVGSSPGPGLAGNVSPLTPGGSPRVNQGDISPLTPNTTPPPPPENKTTDMDVSQADPPAMLTETPPPPPPGEELKIDDVVSMEVDTEELARPQSAYTPPLPPANNANHSTPEKSYTPPLPLVLPPPCPPAGQPSGPPSPHTPPLPPLPKDVGGDDSGGEASMSSISDTDLGDISPPRQRKVSGKSDKKDGDTASDISEEELRLGSDVGDISKNRESDSVTPDKDTGSDEDLQQLERMKAELMAQLEGDFKLSPEESDSEGEADEGVQEATKDSPASPDHSASTSRSETPAAKPPSPSSANSSPNQLQKLRTLPLPSPDYSSMTPGQRIKALPLPGEMSGTEGACEEPAKSHSSPDTLISGPRTPPMPMSRTPSQSPSPPPRKGPQTPPSPPSAFSSNSRPYPPSTPPPESRADCPLPPSTLPQESLSKLDLNDPKPVESTCKPFSQGAGPRTPPGPDNDPEGFGGSTSHPQVPQPGAASSSQDGSGKSRSPTEGSDHKTPANKSSHSHSSSKSHHSSHKHHSSSKDRKSEKKLDKIKEQTKAKIEKYEQKIKSKDKLKSDKFLALDIFSTTKKPSTPYQPHSRVTKPGVSSGSSTPTTSKPPQREFEKKLQESIKKVVQIREEEKEKRRKEEEKKNAFKMPVKIEDRRRSSSGEGIKERRSSKDEKDTSRSKDRHERDRKERKSSTDKERRHSEDGRKEKERRRSEDEKKDSKYEKEREKQALESKKRLHEARDKKEKEEKERKRVKDKERRDKDKKNKEEEPRKEKEKKDTEKDKSKTENLLKSKIGALGSDNIEKMLVEALAEKTGAKFSEDEKKEMLKKLEGLIKKKKDAKESPKKQRQSDEKSMKKVSPKKNNTIVDSSSSGSSDSDSDSESDQKIRALKNRIRERRKSAESEKSGGQSPKRTRPVRNRNIKPTKVESEQSDTDGDFIIKEEILEKAPVKKLTESVATSKEVKPKAEKIEPKIEATEVITPVNEGVKVEQKVKPKVKKTPAKKPVPKLPPAIKKADVDPAVGDLVAFSESEVEFMVSLKEKYDMLLKDEDNISVSSITSEELNAAIPPSRTVVIDAGPDPEETLRIMNQFGGNPRLFTPVPEWLHPYLIGAKVKLEDVGMPTEEEIKDYIQKKQTKSKKRGAGWDIVVEWVPTAPPPAKKTKLEKELGFDVDSSFGQTVALSGGKRTRRANRKYSESDYGGEEVTSSKPTQELNSAVNTQEPITDTMEQDQPNPAPTPTQPSTTIRTHIGSAQTPKRGGRGRKDSLAVRRVEPSKDVHMVIDSSNNVQSDEVKDISERPDTVEDKAELLVNTVEDNPVKVLSEDIVQQEDTSPGKKRRSKDIIAAYLTSAGVERSEDKHDIVEPVEKHDIEDVVEENSQNHVDISCESIIAVTNISDDKETVVAMLDAEISAADEELNSVLKNLKRKRSGSGDSKFHGWDLKSSARPKTGYSILLDAPSVVDSDKLETVGASFGMTDIDFLMSSEESECLLEVVMSQPMLRDVKKAEGKSVITVVGVKPIGDIGQEGIQDKHSDSDNDERGAHSPSSFGSTKENVPEVAEIYNSVSSKFNQKSPSAKRRLKNPVLKTSVKVS